VSRALASTECSIIFIGKFHQEGENRWFQSTLSLPQSIRHIGNESFCTRIEKRDRLWRTAERPLILTLQKSMNVGMKQVPSR
jgi:hypothetical protein